MSHNWPKNLMANIQKLKYWIIYLWLHLGAIWYKFSLFITENWLLALFCTSIFLTTQFTSWIYSSLRMNEFFQFNPCIIANFVAILWLVVSSYVFLNVYHMLVLPEYFLAIINLMLYPLFINWFISLRVKCTLGYFFLFTVYSVLLGALFFLNWLTGVCIWSQLYCIVMDIDSYLRLLVVGSYGQLHLASIKFL